MVESTQNQSEPQEKIEQKHEGLAEDNVKGQGQEIEVETLVAEEVKEKVKPISPFINAKKSWDNDEEDKALEDVIIPEDIKKGIVNELKFL